MIGYAVGVRRSARGLGLAAGLAALCGALLAENGQTLRDSTPVYVAPGRSRTVTFEPPAGAGSSRIVLGGSAAGVLFYEYFWPLAIFFGALSLFFFFKAARILL